MYVCYSFKKSWMKTRVVYFLHPSPCFELKEYWQRNQIWYSRHFSLAQLLKLTSLPVTGWISLGIKAAGSRGVLFPRADACAEEVIFCPRIWSVFSLGTSCVFSPLGTWRKKKGLERNVHTGTTIVLRCTHGTTIVPRRTNGTTSVPPARPGSVFQNAWSVVFLVHWWSVLTCIFQTVSCPFL